MHLRHHISVLLVTCAFGSLALARQPVSAVCTTDPLVTYAGATISVHVTPDGFIPHRKLTYTYRSTDGEVTGDGASTGTVNTTGLQPGNYNVPPLSPTITTRSERWWRRARHRSLSRSRPSTLHRCTFAPSRKR